MIRGNKRLFFFLSALILLCLVRGSAQPSASSNLQSLLDDVVRNSVADRMAPAPVSEEDVREWRTVFALLRERSLDKCRRILAKYDYQLLEIPAPDRDPIAPRRSPSFSARYQSEGTGANYYDVLRENSPLRRGWGTLVFNRNQAKRVYVHVPHPIHDGNSAVLGAELFRSLNAECLMIAGTDRSAGVFPCDVVTLKGSMFEKWHEMLTDLVHLSLSVHGYAARAYPHPIDTTDIVVSNGRTTDEQWGISQISLSVRDTLRASGFRCALAMYDSGYARLAGGANRQGRFSNDSVGFGHWLNLEFSDRVRSNPQDYSRLLGAVDRALAVTGQKISQQMNRAFGLVSPSPPTRRTASFRLTAGGWRGIRSTSSLEIGWSLRVLRERFPPSRGSIRRSLISSESFAIGLPADGPRSSRELSNGRRRSLPRAWIFGGAAPRTHCLKIQTVRSMNRSRFNGFRSSLSFHPQSLRTGTRA
ncbi:MAG: hypothetical protein E6K56_04410 [Ignavibacteria bacterium]|nr:MAG: hypothetical protein E6K56_04410 [Ignavibacteria bacterium]